MRGEHDKTIAYAHQALDQLPESASLIRAQTALYLVSIAIYAEEHYCSQDRSYVNN
jgi:hypothetical protein